MTTLPGWLDAYALDDDTLAVLANRGLVRRGNKEADRLAVLAASDAEVELSYQGTPPATLRLLPGGPTAARCGCPVAGVCVHVVAACVWARTQRADGPPVEPVETGPTPPVEVDETTSPALTELLALDPARVNRAAGVAAVRRVAAGIEPTPTTITPGQGSVRVSWPGSPEVVAVPGGGFAGMLVGGRPSDVEHRALRLEAVVRVWAAEGRSWVWPEARGAEDAVQPGQLEALDAAAAAVETLLVSGLSRVSDDGVARLRAAAQRARLEALPLLGVLLTGAAGRAAAVAAREDDATERDLLEALGRAWSLASAVRAAATRDARAALPAELVGGRRGQGETAQLGQLVPLAARWWLAPSGARGVTVTMWDATHQRLETVSTGRAAGQDPTFQHSWTMPLLWGASAQTICAGPFTLIGAERRDDGTMSPTARTRLVPGVPFRDAGLDLDELAQQLRDGGTADRIGFRPAAADVRLVRLRRMFGAGQPELDEVNQQLVWPLVDRAGVRHLARMDASGPEQSLVGWLIEDDKQIAAVVLDRRLRPLSLFVVEQGRVRLISPSLTPPQRVVRHGWFTRRAQPQRPRAFVASVQPAVPPLAELCEAVLDVCEALASTGRPALSARQRDTLTRRTQQASEVGLSSLAASVQPLLDQPVAPAAVLRASVVAGRTLVLAESPSA